MNFEVKKSIQVLERTPALLSTMLKGLSAEWIKKNEGPNTWSPYDIVGHLIHGEKTDWVPRMEIILSKKGNKKFTPYDRFAQFRDSKGKTANQLLKEFSLLRKKNITRLRSKGLSKKDLNRTGIHPAFGEVTLRQLLATWVVHDLGHIAQISRVMAKQYKKETGPWVEYLKIIQ